MNVGSIEGGIEIGEKFSGKVVTPIGMPMAVQIRIV